VGSKKGADDGVVKLLIIIGLEGIDGETELGGDIGVEGGEGLSYYGFVAERKHPHKVREII
jgi:hypothetical protein